MDSRLIPGRIRVVLIGRTKPAVRLATKIQLGGHRVRIDHQKLAGLLTEDTRWTDSRQPSKYQQHGRAHRHALTAKIRQQSGCSIFQTRHGGFASFQGNGRGNGLQSTAILPSIGNPRQAIDTRIRQPSAVCTSWLGLALFTGSAALNPTIAVGNDPRHVAQEIDRHIEAGLQSAKLSRTSLADDAEFFRRTSLDLHGVVPTPEQVVQFLDSTDPQKRTKAIDELPASPRFGQHFGMAAFFTKIQTPSRANLVSMNGVQDNPKPTLATLARADLLEGYLNRPATFLGGEGLDEKSNPPARVVPARWMTAPENPYCARAAATRMWWHFFGRGIVNPVDDMHSANAPFHPELLETLSQQFVESGFDLKFLCRVILNRRTYHSTSRPGKGAEAEAKSATRMSGKALSAEQLYDSLVVVLGPPAGGSRATAAETPAPVSRSVRGQPQAQTGRHGAGNREPRQATRGGDFRLIALHQGQGQSGKFSRTSANCWSLHPSRRPPTDRGKLAFRVPPVWGPGDGGTPLTNRPPAKKTLRKCHWPD